MISVIIPTRDEGKYIERTLKSVKNQDCKKPFEVIVADYRSGDRTVPIAKKYADRVLQTRVRGAGAGRNAGARAAKGDIFVFLDADTMAGYDLLSVVDKTFKDKRIAGATCPIIPLSYRMQDFMVFWFIDYYFWSTIIAGTPHASGVCFVCRRDAFEKAGGFNEKLSVTEDIDLAMRLRKYGRFVFMRNTLVMTSPRRVQKWGLYRTASVYVTNYLRVLTFGTSARNFEVVR